MIDAMSGERYPRKRSLDVFRLEPKVAFYHNYHFRLFKRLPLAYHTNVRPDESELLFRL